MKTSFFNAALAFSFAALLASCSKESVSPTYSDTSGERKALIQKQQPNTSPVKTDDPALKQYQFPSDLKTNKLKASNPTEQSAMPDQDITQGKVDPTTQSAMPDQDISQFHVDPTTQSAMPDQDITQRQVDPTITVILPVKASKKLYFSPR